MEAIGSVLLVSIVARAMSVSVIVASKKVEMAGSVLLISIVALVTRVLTTDAIKLVADDKFIARVRDINIGTYCEYGVENEKYADNFVSVS